MNSFFIGIGGAGCSAVAEFAQKIRHHGSNVNNAYIYLDTDKGICDTYPFLKDSNDFVDLGGSSRHRGHSIQNIINESLKIITAKDKPEVQKRKYSRFLNWYDVNIESKEELTKGAEGIRMMSRAMLFANYTDIQAKIASRMTYDDPADGQTKIRKIYVISGTCGGTGSGCVIDILYMLNKIRASQNTDATELPVNLLLVMPQGYINGIQDNSSLFSSYRTNAYAIVDEINALLKNYYGYFSEGTDKKTVNGQTIYQISNRKAGMMMNEFCCTDEGTTLQFNVFQNAFLFDSVTHDGHDMSHEQRSENVANFLFALEVGTQANAILDSNISNNVRTEKYNSTGAEFIHAFAASGMYVAQSWEELTRKFVRDKFLYQMLRYGFVGSDLEIPNESLQNDTGEFSQKIQNILTEKKNEQGFGIIDLRSKILSGYGYDGLKKIMEGIKTAVTKGKKPAVESIFADSNSKEEVKALAKVLDSLLSKVKEETYTMCKDWAKRYNLNHALQLAKKMDGAFDDKFKKKIKLIGDLKIDWYTYDKDKRRRQDCANLFDDYIDYLVYRNLSNDQEGYLDDCKNCLTAAINAINFAEHKKDGLKVSEWENDFIKYLNSLSTDNTRSVWPSLNELYNSDNSCLVQGNSVERDYATLVIQASESNSPDLTYNINNNHLLYSYKRKCIDAIERDDAKWANYFDISKGADAFARNVKVAFEIYEKEVEKVGYELSMSESLRKPFADLTLNTEEQKRLATTIESFNRVSLATQYHMQDQPNVGIYVGDFNRLTWLDQKLFPTGYNQMLKSRAQDNQMGDRVFKLFVEFGYPLDEYRYYKDVYKPYFDAFYKDAKQKPNSRHHQPFIDKRFFETGNVDAYFKQSEQSNEIRELNTLLKENKGTFLKFCAWFLYKLLKDHEGEGLLARKGLTSRKGYYKLETARKGKSKKASETVVLGMTYDFDTWKDASSYELSDKFFNIDMDKEYKDSEVKAFSPCIDLWSRILMDEGMINDLDPDKLYEAFDSARKKLKDSSNLSRSTFLQKLAEKYVSQSQEDNNIVDWQQIFGDFMKVFPLKKK